MKTFNEWFKENFSFRGIGDNTEKDRTITKLAWEEGQIAALLWVKDWYGPENYDMADLIDEIDTKLGEIISNCDR